MTYGTRKVNLVPLEGFEDYRMYVLKFIIFNTLFLVSAFVVILLQANPTSVEKSVREVPEWETSRLTHQTGVTATVPHGQRAGTNPKETV